MEWLIILFGALLLAVLLQRNPKLILPQCPICYSSLESIDERDEIIHLGHWHLVWHKFLCPQCWYRWQRIEITRCVPENNEI